MEFSKPENSRGQVNRAGEILRAYAQSVDAVTIEQLDEWEWAYKVLASWRACHNYPINTFQATLRCKKSPYHRPLFLLNRSRLRRSIWRLIAEIAEKLETVTFITNGRADNKKAAMHEVLKKVTPTIRIGDVITDQFHDRFWIDAENKNGIVMGTSLNGIGKKIALVDQLSSSDVGEIAGLAYQLIGSDT
jgi:hypothetical protein